MSEENKNIKNLYADEELIKQWPGFQNRYATVNGVQLHYVEGGSCCCLIYT